MEQINYYLEQKDTNEQQTAPQSGSPIHQQQPLPDARPADETNDQHPHHW